MAGIKKFNNMNLLEKVEYLVKQQLPKDAVLTQQSITVNYSLTVNVTTEDNPFQLTSKTYEVVVEYFSDTSGLVHVMVKDEGKLIKDFNLNLKENGVNLSKIVISI